MAISKKDLSKALMKDFEISYNTSDFSLRKQCDRLSGYAHIALEALEADGRSDFVLLKHDDMRHWWKERKEVIRQKELDAEEKARKAQIKARALLKLTEEEKRALGIKK